MRLSAVALAVFLKIVIFKLTWTTGTHASGTEPSIEQRFAIFATIVTIPTKASRHTVEINGKKFDINVDISTTSLEFKTKCVEKWKNWLGTKTQITEENLERARRVIIGDVIIKSIQEQALKVFIETVKEMWVEQEFEKFASIVTITIKGVWIEAKKNGINDYDIEKVIDEEILNILFLVKEKCAQKWENLVDTCTSPRITNEYLKRASKSTDDPFIKNIQEKALNVFIEANGEMHKMLLDFIKKHLKDDKLTKYTEMMAAFFEHLVIQFYITLNLCEIFPYNLRSGQIDFGNDEKGEKKFLDGLKCAMREFYSIFKWENGFPKVSDWKIKLFNFKMIFRASCILNIAKV